MLANVCFAIWEINRNSKTKKTKPSDWMIKYRTDTQSEKAEKATKLLKATLGALVNGNKKR